MIGEFIYMLPSNMNLRIGKVKDYNNKILISSPSFKIGTNLKINLDVKSKEVEIVKTEPDVKPKVITKPNIEPNKEHKQDVKVPLRVWQFFCFWKLFVALNSCANFFCALTNLNGCIGLQSCQFGAITAFGSVHDR